VKKAREALEAANQNPGAPALILLKATLAIARSDREAASAELRKLCDDATLDAAFLPRLATLLQYAGEGDSADKTLEQYRVANGDVSLWALTRTEILRLRGESPAAIRLLEETLTEVPEPARGPLLRRLAGLEIETGAMRSVRRRLRELRNASTTDLWVYETAADLAIMSRDYEDLKECEEQVAKVESDGSLARYLRAVRLLETETNPQEAAARANPLCRELEAIRPTWPMTRLLRGRIEQRLGRIAAAAESYELALRSGSRNLTNFQWLVATLYRQQRYTDAAAYIRQGGQIAALSGDTLFGMAIPANLKAGRIEDAVRLARSVAEMNPEDVLAQLWHGQTLALAEKPAEAEAVFRKVVDELKLGRGDVRAWSALVWFYARQKRQPEARKALADLIANVTLTALDRELVLARGSDLIGDREEAERHFRQALDDNPKNLKLLEEVGRFYFRFDHDKALDAFRQARAIDPTSLEARRAVALLTGLRGTDADLNWAITILDSEEESTAPDDRRLQAALLLIRGGRDNAAKAVASFRGIVEAQEQPRPGDRLLLARALEESGQIEEAKEQFESVLKHSETPAFLVLYIEFLIRHGRPDDAEKALARLESVDPANARLVELRVDWLTASHRTAEIDEAVDLALAARVEAAKSDGQRAAIARYAADLLTKAECYDAAEKKLRQVIDLLPLAYEPLALWLVERGRLSDALALCFEKAPDDELSRQATVLVRVLTIAAARSMATGPDEVSAETMIAGALKSMAARGPGTATQPAEGNTKQIEQRAVTLLLETGVLRLMQGRNDEALSLYEAALEIDPGNAVVLNNRAVVLAEMPGRADDALRDIDRALATMPNSQELLDSKALVLIGVGKFDESRMILERLCQTNRKNSRYRLHMAFALYCLKNNESAREQLDQALKDGLEKEILTPSERRYLREIAGAGRAAERDDPLRRPAE
jgi:tetratricopeptide (TPR) repeat protein